jgi:hypothetical protein
MQETKFSESRFRRIVPNERCKSHKCSVADQFIHRATRNLDGEEAIRLWVAGFLRAMIPLKGAAMRIAFMLGTIVAFALLTALPH